MIYFDNSATTKTSDLVLQTVVSDLSSDSLFANPGALHKLGDSCLKAYEQYATRTANCLGCRDDEIIFTSCGTESAITAINGYVNRNFRRGKTIITTETEHKATLEVLKQLETKGFRIKYVKVDLSGKPIIDELEKAMDGDTILMCFTHVNNETGAILPIKDIVALRNSYNKKIAIYLDCVQSVGKLDINLTTLGVEMASFSGHKIHAVKGVGVLYNKTGIIVEPFILGGGQQGGMRSGTESLFLANAFATALEETISHKVESASNVSEINEYLRKELLARKALIVSPEDASPYVLNVSFDGFESETMLHCLEKYEIYVSTISACSARTKRISYVLLAMGLDRKIASNSVRLSFSRYNTMDEAKEFISKVDEIYSLYSLKR